MPIADFNGETFVAFLDISGFKEMMKGDGSQAVYALDRLNVAGYDVLKHNRDIAGFFISDCGVLFVKNETMNKKEQLESMLKVVKDINKRLIKKTGDIPADLKVIIKENIRITLDLD